MERVNSFPERGPGFRAGTSSRSRGMIQSWRNGLSLRAFAGGLFQSCLALFQFADPPDHLFDHGLAIEFRSNASEFGIMILLL